MTLFVRSVMTFLVLMFVGLQGALANPAAGPSNVRAVPRYSTPPSILVTWQDVPDETGYEVWRSVDGGPLIQVATLAQNVTSWRDNAINNVSQYRYRLFAFDGAGATIGSDFTTSVTVVWPIQGGHEVLHGFNEVLGWAGIRGGDGVTTGYHDGVDLNRTTSGTTPGDDVLAPRGGIVDQVIPNAAVNDDGFVSVRVEIGPGNFEYDGFNHISNDVGLGPVVAVGDAVAPGQKLAKVGIRRFAGDFADHVHSMVTTGSSFDSSARHFLQIFTSNADRDPLGKKPKLFDENGDGKVVLFRDHNEADKTKYLDYDQTQPFPLRLKPLSGDIDIHVEVTDEQGNNPRQAPIQLGYWIEGPLPATGQDAELDDVKSSTNPYKLYDFRTSYFGAGAAIDCKLVSDIQDTANSGCKGLTDCTTIPGTACNSVIKEGATDFPWPVLHHFIITHAKGENGTRTDVDVNQYWRTKAKEDNGAVTAAQANYAGKAQATKPTDARFPDSEYIIHVLASDLVNINEDLPILNVRLENFTPFIRELSVYQDKDNNSGTQFDADHPGCENELYTYKYPGNSSAYPGSGYLNQSQKVTFARANGPGMDLHKICVKIRFSEGMDSTWANFSVELDPQGASGAPPIAFVGAFSKTYTEDDTWKGQVFVPLDPTGNSDSNLVTHNEDAVIRVKAQDLSDRNNNHRGMDEDADGAPEPDSMDKNHMIKLDATVPITTIQVKKIL